MFNLNPDRTRNTTDTVSGPCRNLNSLRHNAALKTSAVFLSGAITVVGLAGCGGKTVNAQPVGHSVDKSKVPKPNPTNTILGSNGDSMLTYFQNGEFYLDTMHKDPATTEGPKLVVRTVVSCNGLGQEVLKTKGTIGGQNIENSTVSTDTDTNKQVCRGNTLLPVIEKLMAQTPQG